MQTGEIWHGMKLTAYCGGGAYGDVYLAQELSGRMVALKIVSKVRLGEHWRRELKGVINYCRITENRPELLQIFHVEEDEEYFFYTMEAADPAPGNAPAAGYRPDTLGARLQNGALNGAELCSVITGIFAGIRAIHRAGFAHRDVKPDNILFAGGIPKLGDIGLTAALSGTVTQLAGTLDFLPPELRTSESGPEPDRGFGQRSDLYAFGKVIYCAVTGEAPQSWPAIPENVQLTPALKHYLHLAFQLCSRDPLRRLDSAAAVERELARIERCLTVGERFRDRLVRRLRTGVRELGIFLRRGLRWLRHFWYVVLLLLVMAAGGYGWLWHHWKDRYSRMDQSGTRDPGGNEVQPGSVPLPVEVETKLYENSRLGVSMMIPEEWEVLSGKTLKRRLERWKTGGKIDEKTLQRLNTLHGAVANSGGDAIILGYDGEYNDNLVFLQLPIDDDIRMELANMDMEEFRVMFRSYMKAQFGDNGKLYEFSRKEIAGHPCIFFDYSMVPGVNRAQALLFLMEDRQIILFFYARLQTFEERHREFEEALKTLKISEKITPAL